MPAKGWIAVSIRQKIQKRIRRIVCAENEKKSEWERPLTLSRFVEMALIKEIRRHVGGGELVIRERQRLPRDRNLLVTPLKKRDKLPS